MDRKIDRTGEININNQGLKMMIIRYRTNKDIDVEFLDDGYISEHKQYKSFETGKIKNPNFKDTLFIDRTGEVNYNNFGSKMKIIKYRNNRDIDVYFPEYNFTAENVVYCNFKKGNVSCLYERRCYDIGFIGKGKYKAYDENGKLTKCYRTWHHMLERCYDPKFHEKEPTYIGCKVNEEFHNFQNFGDWDNDNYYKVEGETMCLDKDILVKHNKIYSPETCIYVPQTINNLFTKRQNGRGDSLIGTSYHKRDKVYQAQCSLINPETRKYKCKYLGY